MGGNVGSGYKRFGVWNRAGGSSERYAVSEMRRGDSCLVGQPGYNTFSGEGQSERATDEPVDVRVRCGEYFSIVGVDASMYFFRLVYPPYHLPQLQHC